jgi:hypothetical protein
LTVNSGPDTNNVEHSQTILDHSRPRASTRHPIQSGISPQLRRSAAPSPRIPSQFPSHSPAFTGVRPWAARICLSAGCVQSRAWPAGREATDLESVLGNVLRIRISNPQLAVTVVYAPRVMLEGYPNNSQDPGNAECVPKSATGTVRCQHLCSSAAHWTRLARLFTRRLVRLRP